MSKKTVTIVNAVLQTRSRRMCALIRLNWPAPHGAVKPRTVHVRWVLVLATAGLHSSHCVILYDGTFLYPCNILRTNYGPTFHNVLASFRSRTWVVKHGSLSPSWVGVRPYNSSRIVRKASIRTWSSIRCTSPRSCFTTYFFAPGLFFFS